MTMIKSGDLVVLRSGGPVMTVDTVNTDIFDDARVTGVLCVWFDGDKLARVRFDPNTLVPAPAVIVGDAASLRDAVSSHDAALAREPAPPLAAVASEAVGDYADALDSMVDAMNAAPGDAGRPKPARKSPRKPRRPSLLDAPVGLPS
jgi:uncharacterized protein YodC (DUF2158 family)